MGSYGITRFPAHAKWKRNDNYKFLLGHHVKIEVLQQLALRITKHYSHPYW